MNLLFLQWSNWFKRFWCKVVKNWQKKTTKTLTFVLLVMWLLKKLLIAILDDVDENKEVLKKYEEVWEGIKKEIETINGGEKIEYGKDF